MSHAIERIALSERSLATSKTEARSSVSNLDSMDSMASSKMPQVAAKESMGDPLADVEGHRGDGVVTKLDGVAARLHMQDLMNHHAQKALVVQSKRVMGGISRFRVVLRVIVGTAYFDLMIGLLVLADTACIILQQELYPEVDLEFDTTELALRTASVAVTVAFAVELVARGLAQIGLGWSWLLALDGLIVAGSFVEVFVFSIDPLNQTALRLLRPLRGLRLLRAVRGMVRLLRRSASADLALGAFERSLRPLAMIGVAIILSILAASVILVLQLPGIVDDLKEETELEQDVLLRFGSVFAATLTVLKEVFGAHELGTLLMSLFALSRRRFDLTMFVGSVLIFLLISSLCFSGIVCGVLLSQVILKKGDAAADGGMESFRRNQELVLSLNQAFKNAGFDSGDNIDLKDILSVLAVDAAGKLQKSNSEWLQLLGPDGHGRETKEQPVEKHIDDKTEEEEDDDDEETSTGEKEEELDFKQFKCKLQDKGVTMEDLHTAYHELALFGPVCVEDFILCAFRHVANIKTVSMLSFNHQQNKVFWRIQFHGQVVEEALHEMRFKIGRLHSILPSMITELEDAAVELRELEALEGRLDQKKQALQALISEREKDCGFAEIPREEAVQAQRYEKELNALLEEAEMEVEKLAGSERLPAQDATHAINALADEMVSELWGTVLEEIKAAEVGQAKRK